MTKIKIDDIIVGDRARKEMGDVPSMVASIKEFGLIQPIILGEDHLDLDDSGNSKPVLIAGGRRLAALKILGITELEHAVHWVARNESNATEEGRLRLKSMELEENLRRKDMTWPEIIEAKANLMAIMQKIHGQQRIGGLTRDERRTGETDGFGVRKLAAMLGESVGTVSQDLQLAQMITAMPNLKTVDSKSSALRTGTLQIVVAAIKQKQAQTATAHAVNIAAAVAAGQPAPAPVPVDWKLYEGPFESNVQNILSNSVDLVYTDLPYGVDLDEMQNHDTGSIGYTDKRAAVVQMLDKITHETFRILRDERFCVFWFGFNYYKELFDALTRAKFHVNPVPVVWIKHRNSTEAPLYIYANAYEQAIVARKGNAQFIRPGQSNLVDIPAVTFAERVQRAQQPIPLVEKFILDMTLPAATVVDFCAGVGTTGYAAVKNNRKTIMFEKDPTQCILIKSRMEKP